MVYFHKFIGRYGSKFMSNISFGGRVFIKFNDTDQKDTFVQNAKDVYKNNPKAFRDRLTVYNHNIDNAPGLFVVTGEDTNLLDSLEVISPRETIANIIKAWSKTDPVVDYNNPDKAVDTPVSLSVKKLNLNA